MATGTTLFQLVAGLVGMCSLCLLLTLFCVLCTSLLKPASVSVVKTSLQIALDAKGCLYTPLLASTHGQLMLND